MRNALKDILVVGTFAVAVALISFGAAKGVWKERKPLQIFRVVFVDGSFKDLIADKAELAGPCVVLVTEEKPVVYLCFEHMLLPLGPAPAPTPEPTPESTPTPAEPGAAPLASIAETF